MLRDSTAENKPFEPDQGNARALADLLLMNSLAGRFGGMLCRAQRASLGCRAKSALVSAVPSDPAAYVAGKLAHFDSMQFTPI